MYRLVGGLGTGELGTVGVDTLSVDQKGPALLLLLRLWCVVDEQAAAAVKGFSPPCVR